MCVPVPQGVSAEHAAFSTVGAIAMHGVRRARPSWANRLRDRPGPRRPARGPLLVAAGVRVVGLDVVGTAAGGPSRPARWPAPPDGEGIDRRAGPRRTDRRPRRRPVFLAAGGASNGPVETAPSWPATGPGSSTSARSSWTCRGTPTTTRSSTSASRGPTAPAATTTGTSSKASTTRRATSAGPSGGTSSASSTCWRAGVAVGTLVAGIPVDRRPTVYAGGAQENCRGSVPLRVPSPRAQSEPADGPGSGGPDDRHAEPTRTHGRAQLPVGFIGAGDTRRRCCCRSSRGSNVALAHVVTNAVTVGRQRPAAVRVRHRVHQRGRRARRRVARRGLRRHPPPHPRDSCAERRDGQGRFVEKPLALDQRGARPHRRRRATRPATTGSWWDSTGGSPRCSRSWRRSSARPAAR